MKTKFLILTIIFCQLNISAFAQTKEKIDSFIEEVMKERRIVGLQLAIVKNGEIIKTGNYGFASLQDSIPVDKNTIFTINSITKAFTGVAVMQLVEEGKMELQAPISKYLDGLPTSWQNVTIRQLASHISGIPSLMEGNEKFIAEKDDEMWKKVQKMSMEFKTGERFSYNQTNYVLLKKAIEKVSGMTFEEYLKKHQFEKVGMKNTMKWGFGDFYDLTPHAARGYTYLVNQNLTNISPEVFPPIVRTAAGMQSTATEIANWLINIQNLNLLKKEESISEMWTPSILKNGKTAGFGDVLNGYAIGWLTVTRPNHPAVVSVGGGRSAIGIYPKEGLSIVVLTNLKGASPEYFLDRIAEFYNQ